MQLLRSNEPTRHAWISKQEEKHLHFPKHRVVMCVTISGQGKQKRPKLANASAMKTMVHLNNYNGLRMFINQSLCVCWIYIDYFWKIFFENVCTVQYLQKQISKKRCRWWTTFKRLQEKIWAARRPLKKASMIGRPTSRRTLQCRIFNLGSREPPER